MNDPDPNDDTWGDLARELGVEKSTPARPAEHPAAKSGDDAVREARHESHPAHGHADFDTEDDGSSEGQGFADAEVEDADESDAEGAEGEPSTGEGDPGEGPPGTGRKRRRRRRRRKKSGAAAGVADEAETAPAIAPEEAEADAEDEPTDEAEDEAVEIEPEAVPLAADEDAGGDMLRELIATWNVPSWDEIVGQLHRPGR